MPEDNITRVDCKKTKPDLSKGESCKVPLDAFKPCVSDKKFGYPEGNPCIFLKLNKIYNWIPEYYNNTGNLPYDMPGTLKTHIDQRNDKNVVWVSCEGENPADVENLGTNIAYYSLGSEQGFSGNYFPFMSTKGYLQPLVAVHFKSVKRKLNYSKNILLLSDLKLVEALSFHLLLATTIKIHKF